MSYKTIMYIKKNLNETEINIQIKIGKTYTKSSNNTKYDVCSLRMVYLHGYVNIIIFNMPI